MKMFQRKSAVFFLLIALVSSAVILDIRHASNSKADINMRSEFPDLMPLEIPEKNATVGICQSTDEDLAMPASLDSELTIQQVDDITRLAVQRGGGLDDVVEPGDWVIIKPNIVFAPTPTLNLENPVFIKGTATDLRVIKSVIQQLIEEGDARRITLAEGKAWQKVGESGTPDSLTIDGWNVNWPHYGNLAIDKMIAELNASTDIEIDYMDLDYYNTSPYTDNVPVPGGGLSREYYTIPNAILECDKLIAVAVMKTHVLVKASLTQKLFIGISPGEVYTNIKCGSSYPIGFNHFGVPHSKKGISYIDRTASDLMSYHPPDFGIVECFWGMEGFGPSKGETIKRNIVIAGKDPLAVDAVGAYSMGLNPWDLDYAHWNHMKGFGIMDMAFIDVVGPSVDDVVYEFKKATNIGRGCRAWLVNGPHSGQKLDKNYLDEAEEDLNPVDGDSSAGKIWTPYSNYSDYMDLAAFLDNPSFCNTYAFTRIYADSDKDVELCFNSNDGIKIWLNGNVVFKDQKMHLFIRKRGSLVAEKIPVHLNKGENRLLVKVKNTFNSYGFTMFVSEEDGDTPFGIRYSIDPL